MTAQTVMLWRFAATSVRAKHIISEMPNFNYQRPSMASTTYDCLRGRKGLLVLKEDEKSQDPSALLTRSDIRSNAAKPGIFDPQFDRLYGDEEVTTVGKGIYYHSVILADEEQNPHAGDAATVASNASTAHSGGPAARKCRLRPVRVFRTMERKEPLAEKDIGRKKDSGRHQRK